MSMEPITLEPLGPGPVYSGISVWLPQLLMESARRGQTTIENLTFENCLIEGPAVILPIEGCTFDTCNFGDAQGNPRILMLSPMAGDRVTGVVGFRDCRFQGCQFVGVGFTGPSDFLDGMVKALEEAPK